RRRAHDDVGALVRGEPIPLELRPPGPKDDKDDKDDKDESAAPASATPPAGTSFTGLADKLEPEPGPASDRPRRMRWTAWAALATAVAAAAVGALVFLRRPAGVAADPPRAIDMPPT